MIPEVRRGQAADGGSMGADLTTGWIEYGACRRLALQATWAAGSTPLGTLYIQHSNEVGIEGTPTAVSVAGAELAISGNTGSGFIEITDTGASHWRAFYDRTSGDGELTLTYNMKQP